MMLRVARPFEAAGARSANCTDGTTESCGILFILYLFRFFLLSYSIFTLTPYTRLLRTSLVRVIEQRTRLLPPPELWDQHHYRKARRRRYYCFQKNWTRLARGQAWNTERVRGFFPLSFAFCVWHVISFASFRFGLRVCGLFMLFSRRRRRRLRPSPPSGTRISLRFSSGPRYGDLTRACGGGR